MIINIEFQIVGCNTGIESRRCFSIESSLIPMPLDAIRELDGYVSSYDEEQGTSKFVNAMTLEQYFGLAPRDAYGKYTLDDESCHGMLSQYEVDADDDFAPDVVIIGYI